MDIQKLYFTVKEASGICGIGKPNLYKLIAEGSLKAYRPIGKKLLLKTEDIRKMVKKKPLKNRDISKI